MIAQKNAGKKLTDMTCTEFAEETASESPAPGGGSISAYMGALAAALGTMVANLSAHKAGWDDRWKEFSDQADRGHEILQQLLHLVDEDTEAFNRIMDAFKMPKSSEEEKAARAAAIEDATLYATRIPLSTMETACAVFPLLESMARTGNPASKRCRSRSARHTLGGTRGPAQCAHKCRLTQKPRRGGPPYSPGSRNRSRSNCRRSEST